MRGFAIFGFGGKGVKAKRIWYLEAGDNPQITTNKETEILILQLHKTEFANNLNEQETNVSLKPLERNMALPKL